MMPVLSISAQRVLSNPLAFLGRVARGFLANQGWLLAGAIAYYTLLSLVPLLILSIILLSHLVEQRLLIDTLAHYLEWLVPSQSSTLLGDVFGFLEKRLAVGTVFLVSLLFFSAQAFSVVEKAMVVIFRHRHVSGKRHVLLSAILPYSFVFFLVVLLLIVTVLAILLQALAGQSIEVMGRSFSFVILSGPVLQLLGLGVVTLIFAALYMIMPVGRTRLSHALFGGFTAALAWEAARHALIWYFTTMSTANIIYGSLATSVIVLLSLEIAASLLLLGAQVIAEYERIGQDPLQTPDVPSGN